MVKLSRLKGLRQRKALTQLELAQRAGVDRSTISRLESEAEGAFPTTVRKLATALEVAPEDLLDPRATAATGPSRGVRHSALPQSWVATDNAREFLKKKPELTAVLRQAMNQLEQYFPDARMRIQLLADPDYGEGEQLLLEVSTDLAEAEAVDALRRFDQEWWTHHAHRARGLLSIDLAVE